MIFGHCQHPHENFFMYAKRTDSTQTAIVKTLEKMGAVVHDLSGHGRGIPDLLVGYRGLTVLVECKADSKAKFTPAQQDFLKTWKGGIMARVHDLDGVFNLINTLNNLSA